VSEIEQIFHTVVTTARHGELVMAFFGSTSKTCPCIVTGEKLLYIYITIKIISKETIILRNKSGYSNEDLLACRTMPGLFFVAYINISLF
jgi:hypothetical protein